MRRVGYRVAAIAISGRRVSVEPAGARAEADAGEAVFRARDRPLVEPIRDALRVALLRIRRFPVVRPFETRHDAPARADIEPCVPVARVRAQESDVAAVAGERFGVVAHLLRPVLVVAAAHEQPVVLQNVRVRMEIEARTIVERETVRLGPRQQWPRVLFEILDALVRPVERDVRRESSVQARPSPLVVRLDRGVAHLQQDRRRPTRRRRADDERIPVTALPLVSRAT